MSKTGCDSRDDRVSHSLALSGSDACSQARQQFLCAVLQSFEFYCWWHTFGTCAAQSGMDRFTLARLMGYSSPAVAARYYIHVTETHVAAGFGKFVEYQTRNVAEGLAAAIPYPNGTVQ